MTSKGKQRYENKLNKIASKANKSTEKYKSYESQYKLSELGAKKALTPVQYGRWAASGARMEQTTRLKQLKKASNKEIEKKTNKYIKELSDNYVISFDVATNMYILKDK